MLNEGKVDKFFSLSGCRSRAGSGCGEGVWKLDEMSENGRVVGPLKGTWHSESASLEGLIESAAREWKLTVDAVDSALLVVDSGIKIRRLNLAASRLSGLDFAALVGRPFEALGPGEPWSTGRSLLATALETGQPQTAPAESRATGRRWDLVVHLPAPRCEDEPQGSLPDRAVPDRAVLVIRDITRELELQESLRRSELMSALGSLVAGVAHEVRNPLFGIAATLDAFESRFGDRSDQAQYLYVLRTQLARLNMLMHQLLDYGKPAQLAVTLERVEELLADAVASRAPLAERCGVAVELRCEPELPRLVMDRQRLAQVLENLIENSLYHSPRGATVEVLATAEVNTGPGGERVLLFQVLDRGPGFAAADLPRVFEPFFTRRAEGTGLGLSIVHRIVELHGGTVVAGPREGGGAVVAVRLPCRSPEAAEGGG